MSENILSTFKLSRNFGALSALRDVEITVKRGDIHGIIGPNGAGKTTFINVVSGCLPPSSGECYLEGKVITNAESHNIAKMSLTRTFQQGQIFPMMTCLQNVMVGRHRKFAKGFLKTIFRPPFVRSHEEERARQRALELLDMVGLADAAEHWATELNWVECQLLQIARALVSEPNLLILDEPTAGMGIDESQDVGSIIRKARGMGVTVILISHDMNLVMDIADRVTVLNFGEKIFEGSPSQAKIDPKVLEAYLGEE